LSSAVTENDSLWATTSGTFYWPITEMQFFGYTNDVTYTAPASSSAYPTISYTLPDTPADQKDIIVAYSKDVTKPSDNYKKNAPPKGRALSNIK
jgi:hypothetical protein